MKYEGIAYGLCMQSQSLCKVDVHYRSALHAEVLSFYEKIPRGEEWREN